ncbi:GTPase IMAP family member 9-like [Saccostrea cucullata]|uniref:GTPase IMAP family member 9-like n=1 Tax=Saccostrea cuccullata TaxID=36930 RepID=UPI002ED125E4
MPSSDSSDIQVDVLDDDYENCRMLIAGLRGVGKSALTNSIAGSDVQVSKGSLGSVTQKASQIKCKRKERYLVCFDTPGLSTINDTKLVQEQYEKCLIKAAPGFHAILVVQKAISFSDDNENFLNKITKMFGEDLWKFVVFVFTHIDQIEESLEKTIGKGDKRLHYWLHKCEHRYVGINNKAKGEENEKQISKLLDVVEKMKQVNCCKIYTNEDFKKTYTMLKVAARDLKVSVQNIRDNPGKILGFTLEVLKYFNNP